MVFSISPDLPRTLTAVECSTLSVPVPAKLLHVSGEVDERGQICLECAIFRPLVEFVEFYMTLPTPF